MSVCVSGSVSVYASVSVCLSVYTHTCVVSLPVANMVTHHLLSYDGANGDIPVCETRCMGSGVPYIGLASQQHTFT